MIKIIVAIAENNVIGNNGKLPWHIKKDLSWFEQQTTGQTVVMGRKSYEDIITYTKNKPLRNRTNIVLTSNNNLHDGFIAKSSVEEILKDSYATDLMIIGGTNVFKAFLPFADQLIITEIHKSFEGDTYFPEWNKDEFNEVGRIFNEEHNLEFSFDFVRYVRK